MLVLLLLSVFPIFLSACNPGESNFNSQTCLHFILPAASFEAATDFCVYIGSSYAIASVQSAYENNFMIAEASTKSGISDKYWIGLVKVGNQWVWLDGSSSQYRNWAPGEPKNITGQPRAAVRISDGFWYAVDSMTSLSFLCTSPTSPQTTIRVMPTTPKGIVTTVKPTPTRPRGNSCPGNFHIDQRTGYCYAGFSGGGLSSWPDAENFCEIWDTDYHESWLASIHSNLENQVVVGNAMGYSFLGLRGPTRDNMTWSDGTPVDYTNWIADDGSFACYSGDCCALLSPHDQGKWYFTNCIRREDDDLVEAVVCKAIPV